MKATHKISSLALVLAVFTGHAHAESTVSAKVSTLGFGAEYVYDINPNFSVVGGINRYSLDRKQKTDDAEYKGELTLSTVSGGVRYSPWDIGFFLGTGLYLNNNGVSLKAQPKSQSFTFNGTQYSTSDLGDVKIKVEFPKIAPAVSLGWQAKLFGSDVSVTPEVGILFTGSPKLSTSVKCSADATTCGNAESDIEAERKKIQKDLDKFNIYPLLSIGVGYSF